MGRGRPVIRGVVRQPALSALLALLMGLAACSNASTNGSTTSTSAAATSSTTTAAPGQTTATTGTSTSTTQAPPRTIDGPDMGVLVTLEDRLEVRAADGQLLSFLGDESRDLRIAFDDLNAGIIYQYADTPPEFGSDAVLHMARGASSPSVLLSASDGEAVTLLDVGLLDGLVTILVGVRRPTETALVSIPLAGGAPREVLTVSPSGVDPPADNDFLYREVIAGAVGGSLIGHLIVSDDGCQFPEARRSDQRFLVDPLISACDNGAATLVDVDLDGLLLSYVVDGDDAGLIRGIDLDRMAPTGQPTIPIGGTLLDLADGVAIVTYPDGYLLTDFVATQFEALEGNVRAVTALRSIPLLATDAFLGGFRTPDTCSGFDVSPISDVDDLPPAVAEKRAEITDAIRSCDFLGLAALTASSFTASLGGGAPLDLWAKDELRGLTPLGDIARTLELPHVVIENADGMVYVWPSAVGDDPQEADWVALEALYNEEEIELWRTDGYTGLRIGITDRGVWLYAVAGD